MDPKKHMPFAERMRKGIHIHASSAAAAASSVASASASLACGFYSWSGATCRLRKKSVEIIILHNFCKHLQPLFLHLSRRNQSWHVIQHHHPGYIYIPYALQKFSPQEQPRHISSAAACSSAGASASATSSEAGAWQCRYAIKRQVELVSFNSTTTHHRITIHLQKSPGASSHMFTKQTWELTEWNRTP